MKVIKNGSKRWKYENKYKNFKKQTNRTGNKIIKICVIIRDFAIKKSAINKFFEALKYSSDEILNYYLSFPKKNQEESVLSYDWIYNKTNLRTEWRKND